MAAVSNPLTLSSVVCLFASANVSSLFTPVAVSNFFTRPSATLSRRQLCREGNPFAPTGRQEGRSCSQKLTKIFLANSEKMFCLSFSSFYRFRLFFLSFLRESERIFHLCSISIISFHSFLPLSIFEERVCLSLSRSLGSDMFLRFKKPGDGNDYEQKEEEEEE